MKSLRSISRSIALVVTAAGLVLVAGQASAQPDRGPRDDRAAGPLGGPPVREHRMPGVEERFGDRGPGGPNRRGEGQAEIPMDVFVRALGALKSDDVPEGARLTADQEAKLREIGEQMQRARREFAQQNRGEGRGERRPDRGDRMDDRMDERPRGPRDEAMGQERGMRQGPPRPGDAQKRMYSVLTEKQRAIVVQQLEGWRKEAREKRSAQYMERRRAEREQAEKMMKDRGGEKRGPGPERDMPERRGPQAKGDERGGERGGERGSIDPDRLPPRVRELWDSLTPRQRERIQNMSPQERREALRTLMERRGRGGAESGPR